MSLSIRCHDLRVRRDLLSGKSAGATSASADIDLFGTSKLAQDGKGYLVHGIRRRSSLFNTGRVDHLYQDEKEQGVRFKLHYGDRSAESANSLGAY